MPTVCPTVDIVQHGSRTHLQPVDQGTVQYVYSMVSLVKEHAPTLTEMRKKHRETGYNTLLAKQKKMFKQTARSDLCKTRQLLCA